MSFKREGDDISLLRNLKSRRVTELLAEHIPDDEALLLKNGKYTCIVCKHRPICDTLDILAIHRKGRKHLENLATFLGKQEELKNLIIQRRHEQLIQTGNSKISIAKGSTAQYQGYLTTSRGPSLLKEIPYRSRIKRKVKLTDRKITLDIKSDSNNAISSESGSSVTVTSQTCPKIASMAVESYLKSIKSKGSFEELVEKSRDLRHLPTPAPAVAVGSGNSISAYKQKKPTSRKAESPVKVQNEQRCKKADYFLNLCRDGWKRNLDGTWTKDEQAEFDSDEEVPPAYVE